MREQAFQIRLVPTLAYNPQNPNLPNSSFSPWLLSQGYHTIHYSIHIISGAFWHDKGMATVLALEVLQLKSKRLSPLIPLFLKISCKFFPYLSWIG